jgi:hypothetical protein
LTAQAPLHGVSRRAPPGSRRFCEFADFVGSKAGYHGFAFILLSPSRHIYKPLTITVAFGCLLAFDRVWQHPIKVDGTFA